MIIRGANVFHESGKFVREDLAVSGEWIGEGMPGGDSIDATGCYAIPGLIDIHQHGSMGYDYSSASLEGIAAMAEYQASFGVTAVCATTLTLAEEALGAACRRISESTAPRGAALVGVNLEGPFVSPQKLGAQNPDYVQRPDASLFRRIQAVSGNMVKLLAVAPEEEGALDVIRALCGEVVCSIAHTTADYDTSMSAFVCGARHVTHMYNAMPPFSHRAPGVVGAAFDTPDCMVELICDGVHIHPSVVRATFQMFGDCRIVMISDSMMATGLSDGEYELGGLPVRVVGNRATLVRGGAIAGSATNLMDCVRMAVRDMGIPLASAVKCASVNPARAIGIFRSRGSLTPGKYADIVLLEPDLSIRQVILRGKPIGA